MLVFITVMLASDWVTKDLLSKVEKHPNLSRVFQDPNLTEILLEFQKDPQKAMAAAKDNKEVCLYKLNQVE